MDKRSNSYSKNKLILLGFLVPLLVVGLGFGLLRVVQLAMTGPESSVSGSFKPTEQYITVSKSDNNGVKQIFNRLNKIGMNRPTKKVVKENIKATTATKEIEISSITQESLRIVTSTRPKSRSNKEISTKNMSTTKKTPTIKKTTTATRTTTKKAPITKKAITAKKITTAKITTKKNTTFKTKNNKKTSESKSMSQTRTTRFSTTQKTPKSVEQMKVSSTMKSVRTTVKEKLKRVSLKSTSSI